MTNRELFNKTIREEFEAKMGIWESMSEEEFLDWITRKGVHLDIKMGEEMVSLYLKQTKSISVCSIEELKVWLKQTAKEA